MNHLKGLSWWVYISANPAMPGLLKIEISSRAPTERTGTGDSNAFRMEYEALVRDFRRVGGKLHAELAKFSTKGTQNGNELFACGLFEAIATVRKICANRLILENCPSEIAAKMKHIAEIAAAKPAQETIQAELELKKSQKGSQAGEF